MPKQLLFPLALSLSALACTQQTAGLPRLTDAPPPDTAALRVDSALVPADDWHFSAETGEIFLLRADSLFSSPVKPLRWQFRGADPAWRGRAVFRVCQSGGGIAVLFTAADTLMELVRAPLLWFSGKKTAEFSPAAPAAGHRWQLIPGPVLPDNRGLFLYLRQYVETPKTAFDSTAIYWLGLQRDTLIRLPFQHVPAFYDTTLCYAFFQTGSRYYPEEEQSFPSFHRFDTQSGAILPGVPDPRLREPWCLFRCDPWDERPCLVEKWTRQQSKKGMMDAGFEGIRLPDGSFIRFDLPRFKTWDQETADSMWTDAMIFQHAGTDKNLYFRAGGALYRVAASAGAGAVCLGSALYQFGAFPNGAGFLYSQSDEDARRLGYQTGNLFLFDVSGKERMDLFAHLRRAPGNRPDEAREVFGVNMMDVAGFLPSPVRLCKIWQGFMPKQAGAQDKTPTVDQQRADFRSFGGVAPLPLDRMERHALLYQDGRFIFVDLSFPGKHESDFQTLLFHPSGAILARDWRSGNLRWWGFEIPD